MRSLASNVTVVTVLAVLAAPRAARADDVFEVCKGESKGVVAGTGQMSIAVYYPEAFPVATTPVSRNAIGAQLATREKAKIVPAKDVAAAVALVSSKQWSEGGAACGIAPSLVAVLGQRHPNLSTATASVSCTGDACELHVDLERHGKRSAERWVRYSAPLVGPKDQIATITAAGKKLVAKGEPPAHPKTGLAVAALTPGVVTVRSNVDGALEADRLMESAPAFAACRPAQRKTKDVRGFWAEWTMSARGNAYQVMVKPFAGRDPADAQVADCLKGALEKLQLACPRDAKPVPVRTAICL